MAHKTAPASYVDWINRNLGFNPRGQQQSDCLSQCIVSDLRQVSPEIRTALDTFGLHYTLNMTVESRVIGRVVDLVFYDPVEPGPLNRAKLSVEHKTIMTAHGKARKNRVGDIVAYCNHVHNHSRRAIAAATLVINTSSEYVNPDAFREDTPRRQLTSKYIRETMELFTGLPLRESVDEPNDQPDALAVIVVAYDGEHQAELITCYPALPSDSPHSYDSFIARIARLYKERFCS